MVNFLKLLQNENMKIYRRPRTWILLGSLFALAVTTVLLVHFFLGEDSVSKEERRQEIAETEKQLEQAEMPESMREDAMESLKLQKYRLENDIPSVGDTLWGSVLEGRNIILLVTIFTVIVAGGVVAGEFSWGSIKLLLTRPVSRTKILLSKYMATLLFALLLLVTLFITSFIVSGIVNGFAGAGEPYIYLDGNGDVQEKNMLLHVLQAYGLDSVKLLMVVTFALMISTIFRSSALAIGLSIGIMFIGPMLTTVFQKYEWIKYFLFANTDLTQYISGSPLRDDMTMGFSLAVLAVYFIIFNVLMWWIFNKRDVAA